MRTDRKGRALCVRLSNHDDYIEVVAINQSPRARPLESRQHEKRTLLQFGGLSHPSLPPLPFSSLSFPNDDAAPQAAAADSTTTVYLRA
jgi:hypothetical protein